MIASRTDIRGADVAQHYDELDAFYRQIWGENVHHGLWRSGHETLEVARQQLEAFVADEAALTPGERVCDIGCGYGVTARMLAEERRAQVTAITISPAQHAVAVERNAGRDNPRFVVGDWLENDLPSSSFDAAIAVESSEHMPDKPAFFAQARRVLRPGGRLVVASWLVGEAPARWQQRWLLEPICREARMPILGAETDYRKWMAEAGFAVQRFQDITPLISPTWPMIVATFARRLLQHPSILRLLVRGWTHHAIFAFTISRLCIAFRTGALRYGVFTLSKSGA